MVDQGEWTGEVRCGAGFAILDNACFYFVLCTSYFVLASDARQGNRIQLEFVCNQKPATINQSQDGTGRFIPFPRLILARDNNCLVCCELLVAVFVISVSLTTDHSQLTIQHPPNNLPCYTGY